MWQQGHLTVNHKVEALRSAPFSPQRPAAAGEKAEMDRIGPEGWRPFYVLIALRTELIKRIKSLSNRLLP